MKLLTRQRQDNEKPHEQGHSEDRCDPPDCLLLHTVDGVTGKTMLSLLLLVVVVAAVLIS